MSDNEADKNTAQEGKVVHLDGRRRDAEAADLAKGKSVPRTPRRNLHWYPKEQKRYYRELLQDYCATERIGREKLRDMIMEQEDAELVRDRRKRGLLKSGGFDKDDRLTYSDIKKWLSPSAKSDIGPDKFYFVDRFVKRAILPGMSSDMSEQVMAAKDRYHIDALKSLFPIGLASEACSVFPRRMVFLGFIEHRSTQGYFGRVRHIVIMRNFNSGIGLVTILEGSTLLQEDDDLDGKFRDSYVPSKDRPIFLGSGYAIPHSADQDGDDLNVSASLILNRMDALSGYNVPPYKTSLNPLSHLRFHHALRTRDGVTWSGNYGAIDGLANYSATSDATVVLRQIAISQAESDFLAKFEKVGANG